MGERMSRVNEVEGCIGFSCVYMWTGFSARYDEYENMKIAISVQQHQDMGYTHLKWESHIKTIRAKLFFSDLHVLNHNSTVQFE